MSAKVELRSQSKNQFAVYCDKKLIGSFIRDVDGYFYYIPHEGKGFWSAHTLRLLADHLDNLNREWDKEISKICGNPLKEIE